MTITEALGRVSDFAHRRPSDAARYDIESEQRYRTMAGMDEPLAARGARARDNAARTPLSRKTW